MYQDASRNPVDAMTLASTIVDALAVRAGSLSQDPGLTGGSYVSVADYNALVYEYNDLVRELAVSEDAYQKGISRLEREVLAIRLENARLRKML